MTEKKKVTARIKLYCGHHVETTYDPSSDTAWCPICKHDLFTGWPEHMEEHVQTATRLKKDIGKYLDECIETGVEPRLAAIVGAAESVVRGVVFSNGYKSGGAIDAD
jgi:hypothetical protein